MKTETTPSQRTDMSDVLHVAIDLGGSTWKLVSGTPGSARTRCRTIDARDLKALETEIAAAKKRFRLPSDADVVSCYEAGRDGFWLHRHLLRQGIANVVIDSASCEVSRRAKQVKTDRLDGEKLLDLLMRYYRGGRAPFRIVNVPPEEVEDARRLHRERSRLLTEEQRQRNRMQEILISFGIATGRYLSLDKRLEELRSPDGKPLGECAKSELRRAHERLIVVHCHQRKIKAERLVLLQASGSEAGKQVETLAKLRGLGWESAAVLVYEFFLWRGFRNRRQVGAAAGMVSAPWLSDGIDREQGISKAGNHRVRALMVQIAWGWLRFQPDSAISKWFRQRCEHNGRRVKKIAIVAVARRLLIALWRLLEDGTVPEGAKLTEGSVFT